MFTRNRAAVPPLVAALVVVLVGTSAFGAVFASEEKLAEGRLFAQNPMFKSEGYVGVVRSDGYVYPRGSGVLIDSQWVLTAAHVIVNSTDIVTFEFGLGPDFYNDWGESRQASVWHIHPGYSGSYGSGVDLALIHLSEPILDVAPAVRYRGTDQVGTLMYSAGFGRPGIGDVGLRPWDGVMSAGNNIADLMGSPFYGVEDQYWLSMFDPPGDPECQPLEWQGSPGDSGGGWFAEFDGSMQLVGITSFVLGDYWYGSYTGALRVSLYNDWIDSYVPEPGTVLLLLFGAVFFCRRTRKAA